MLGSQARFARLIGVAQPSVWKWLDRGKALPAEHVLRVEQSTGVSRHLLRPDIYPADETASATTPYRPDPAAVRPNEALPFGSETRS